VSAQLDFLDPPPDPAQRPAPKSDRVERKRKARDVRVAGARRWINGLKIVAIEVAKRDGRVYAETLRAAAEPLGKLPPTYGEQRSLSFLPAVFLELCQAGHLRKVRHPNGAPVRIYSKTMRNDQVVYELAEVAP
jgi:hypothetical protein